MWVGGGCADVLCLQMFYGAGVRRWVAYWCVNPNESSESSATMQGVGVFGHVVFEWGCPELAPVLTNVQRNTNVGAHH